MFGNHEFMKKLNGAALVVGLMLCVSLGVAAQESAFKEEDLNALKKNASEKLTGKTYRLTTTFVKYANGSSTPLLTEKTVGEFLPPERTRFVIETTTAEGLKRYESINIGERRFVRNDNGEWKELGGYGIGMGGGIGSGVRNEEVPKIETTVERRLKKGERLNNQTADFYETVTITKYTYQTRTYTNVWKTGYWFDANGMFIRTESEYQSGDDKSVSRAVREYDYNANIKIEAPIIKSEQKNNDKP